MTKTIHPLLSNCSSTKWGEGRGHLFERGAYFKFLPIGEVLSAYSRGGVGANSKIYGNSTIKLGPDCFCHTTNPITGKPLHT